MKLLYAVTLAAFLAAPGRAETEKAPESSTKAGDLYPNDFGPADLDVSDYPKPIREGYKLTVFKCAACHTPARPLNSQFLELSAEEEEAFKKEHPDIYKDKRVVHIEDKIWNRYVKRMMTKPGCPVKGDDGKKIWEFLAHDSRVRKTGPNAEAWAKHRRRLLHEFAEKYPAAYKKLYGDAPAPQEK